MGKVDEYRKRARECVELAEKLKPADRPRLLGAAQAWLTLADRAEKEERALREIGKFPPMSSDTGHQAASGSILPHRVPPPITREIMSPTSMDTSSRSE